MTKKIILFMLGCFMMIDTASSQSKELIVEEGGTGRYKSIMKEEASLPAHTVSYHRTCRPSMPLTPSPFWYGAMVPVLTRHGNTSSSSTR